MMYTFSGSNATVTGHKDGNGATGTLTIPSTVTSGGTTYTVRNIADNAFLNYTGLTGSLVIPNTVTVIGRNAFAGCTGFNGTLTLSNQLEIIRTQAFRDCSGFIGALTIPNSVTNFQGSNHFYGCSGFTSLTLGTGVSSLPEGMFYGCSGLTGNLVIPNNVTIINNSVFSGCSGLNGTLTLSNNLTSIGQSAFRACTNLTGDLTIPNSVTSLGQEAFYNCSGFNGTLTLSNQLITISVGAFLGCSGFTGELVIPNSVQTIGNNAFVGCGSFTGLTIGSSVTSLGSTTFASCTGLTHIIALPATPPTPGNNNTFGNVPTSIPVYVPRGCASAYQAATGWSRFTNILEVNYDFSAVAPTGQTLYYIITDATNHYVTVTHPNANGAYPWDGFTKPTGDLTIPSTVEHESVTYTVKAVGDGAFNGCAGINGLVLPNTLESIGWNGFRLCTGTTGTLTLPSSLTFIDGYAFGSCGFTGTLTIPSSITSISQNAFQFCESFTALELPNSIETIGPQAFQHCTGLTSLTLPNSLTTIGASAFFECTGLTGELIIPNSVTTIGASAFYHCTGFTGDLLIPNSVTSIGTYAFYDCTGFNRSLIFPARPERNLHIGNDAFHYCLNIVEIIMCGETPPTPVGTDDNVDALAGLSDDVLLYFPTVGWNLYRQSKYFAAIPNTDLNHRWRTLYDFKREYNGNTYYYNVKTRASNLSHYYPNNFAQGQMTELPSGHQFRNYWKVYLTCPGTQLNPYGGFEKPHGQIDIEEFFTDQTITLPGGNGHLTQHPCILTKVDDKAFYGCDELTGSLFFNNFPYYTYTYFEGIGADAFNGCTGLTELIFIMPGKCNYNIGARAFYGCTGLTGDLLLAGGINSIGDYAFYGCTSLDGLFRVGISGGSGTFGIKEIGVSAFENCNFTGGSSLNHVNAIHESAFKNSGFDGTLRIYGYDSGSNDQIIENGAFMNCRFSSINISEVPHTIIGDSAFYGCNQAHGDIVLHRNVKTIGAHAFDGCTSLDGSLTIHDLSEMETIGAGAFKNCQFSGQLFLPTTVSTIGAEAFAGNDEITSILYLGELNNAQSNSFNGMVNSIPIYINNEYVEQLPQAVGWNYFSNYQSYHNLPYSPHHALGQWLAIEDNPVGTINTEWSRIVTPANAGYIERQRASSVAGLEVYNMVMGCNSSASPSQSNPVTMVAMLPMIADPINLTVLTFGLQSSSISCQPFEVGYVLNDNPSTFVAYRTYEATAERQEIEVAYNGVPRNARMAFRYKVTSSGAKGTSWSVSTLFNLAVKVSATDLAAYGYDGNSITFEWWAQGGEQWELQHRSWVESGTLTADQNPFTTDGWDYTLCWVKVRAVGHDSENEPYYSDWSEEIKFWPGCDAMDSYSEDFENATVTNWTNTLPDCWLKQGSLNPFPQSHCNHANTGNGCLAMGVYDYSIWSSTWQPRWDDQYCVLPEITALNQKKMTFSAKYPAHYDFSGGGGLPHPVNSDGYTTTLKVGYVTDLDNSLNFAETFVQIGEIELTEYYEEYSFRFYSAPAEGARICFCMPAVEGKNIYAMIDDLVVEDMDECDLPVENFRAYGPGYTTAYVNWNDVEGVSQVEIQYWAVWEYYPVSEPYQPTSIIVSNTQKPFKVTGLTPGQSYEFRARQYCNSGLQGEWTDRMPIRMWCYGDQQSTPYAEGFSDNEIPPCWTLRDGSEGKVGAEQKALRLHPNTGDCGVYMPKMSNLPNMKLSMYATRRAFLNSAVHVRICTNIDHPEGNTIDLVTIGQLETAPYNFTNTTYEKYDIHFSTFNNIPDEGYIEFYCESNPYPDQSFTGTCDVMIDDILVYEEVASNKHFVGASTVDPTDWHIAQNWDPVGVPTAVDNVYIDDNNQVVISQPAEANNVDFNPHKSSITIKGDGQLNFQYGHDRPGQVHNKRYLTLKLEKEIQAYTPGERDGYYLINIPYFKKTLTTKVNDYLPLMSGSTDYDPNTDAYLFKFYQNLEWINLKSEDQAWIRGWSDGILFARAANTTLQYNGVDVACGGERQMVDLSYIYGNYPLIGWNLIGNPYSCDAYVLDIRSNSIPYYRMNATGDAIILAQEGSPVGIAEGFFVLATQPNQTAYLRTTPPVNLGRSIDLALSKKDEGDASTNATLDRVRIRFDESEAFEHCNIITNPNRLYIPSDNKQLAVAKAGATGELPLNLEVAADGTYTIVMETGNPNTSYLHLIDSLTGADIDLLQTPEYTFSAKAGDNANRFKVVFSRF